MNTNELIEKVNSDEIINQVKKYSQNADIYIVGGTIRDFYLGEKNTDKDIIVVNADAETVAKNMAKSLDATFVPLDDVNKIYRIVLPDKVNFIDVAGVIGDNLEDDLKRRDFTINSIAVNLKTMELIDLNNGLNDLKLKKIRHISEQNFVDDPLRLLRVYRFAATLGFELDSDLTQIIKNHAPKINKIAVERINYELLKMFSGDFASKMLEEMDKTGLLKEILPVSQELKKIPPNSHHHLDLFSHSIETVRQIEIIYQNTSKEVKQHLQSVDFGGLSRLAHLKFAGFLHDIGKPQTWTIEQDTGRHRFIKHDDTGAKLCTKILKSNKFSKKQIEYIAKMIKFHIYPSNVVVTPDINEKVYMRFIRKMEADLIDIIILAMADRYSARGVKITEDIVNKNIKALQALLDYYLNIKDSLQPLQKLLSGEEIMEILNIKPSKALGEIIKTLKEEQLSGNITTKQAAIDFITKNYMP